MGTHWRQQQTRVSPLQRLAHLPSAPAAHTWLKVELNQTHVLFSAHVDGPGHATVAFCDAVVPPHCAHALACMLGLGTSGSLGVGASSTGSSGCSAAAGASAASSSAAGGCAATACAAGSAGFGLSAASFGSAGSTGAFCAASGSSGMRS